MTVHTVSSETEIFYAPAENLGFFPSLKCGVGGGMVPYVPKVFVFVFAREEGTWGGGIQPAFLLVKMGGRDLL